MVATTSFSVECLNWCIEGQRLVQRLPKPRPDGPRHVAFAVSELLDRLAALTTPPRRHRKPLVLPDT